MNKTEGTQVRREIDVTPDHVKFITSYLQGAGSSALIHVSFKLQLKWAGRDVHQQVLLGATKMCPGSLFICLLIAELNAETSVFRHCNPLVLVYLF